MSRARGIASRLLRFVATFLIVTFLATLLVDLVPGSPALYMAGEGATPEVVDAVNQKYGFDEPIVVRYGHWLGDLVTKGELGESYVTREPVLDAIRARLPITLQLAVMSLALTLLIAIPTAMAAARRPGSRVDRAIGMLSSAMISIPAFALALLLAYVFALRLKWFPLFGWAPISEGLGQNLRGAVLPVLSMVSAQAVIIMRVLRADLIQTLQQDYIALARSKGLTTRAIRWTHALRPSSFSLLTLSGVALGAFMGGTVIVESIFLLPGIGQLIYQAIASKDLITIQGVVTFFAIAFLVINLVVDLLYGVLDPRSRRRA
jgi:peptide/nickel transport system permease protein